MGGIHDIHDAILSHILEARQAVTQGNSSTATFLNLIADPFETQVQANSIYAALVWSFAVSGGLFLLFILLRPRDSQVYARRLKVADEKHAPRSLDRSLLGFIPAIRDVKEQEMVGLWNQEASLSPH
jgi:hypothetical protein